MANALTKALNKLGASVSGNSSFNIWHNINQIGAGGKGVLKSAVTAIPNVVVGAVGGAVAGGIPGAIVGACAGGLPVTINEAKNAVAEYNAEHGYSSDGGDAVGGLIGGASGLAGAVSNIAGAVSSVAGDSKVGQVAGAVASIADAVKPVADSLNTAYNGNTGASGPVVTAHPGGVSTDVPSPGASAGTAAQTGKKSGADWRKTYIPVTERWEKTAPIKKK